MTKEEIKQYHKEYRERNKEKIKEYHRLAYEKNKEGYKERARKRKEDNPEYQKEYHENNKERYLWLSSRRRANKRGLEFNIDLEDIRIPDVCPVLKIPLFISKDRANDNSPSLDRFDNTKGYTKENIRVISWRANRLKGDGTADEHRKIADWADRNG